MPKSTSETLNPEGAVSDAAFVLDFLYHDSRRIGSFLSQFEGDGHLQQFTRTKSGSRNKKEANVSDLKGNVGLVAGSLKGSVETGIEMAEGYSRVFDPYWANARAFLDYLSERGMLQRDIGATRIGQFVLVKGWLSILDLVMLKDAWKLPTLQKKVLSGTQSNKSMSQMTAVEKNAHKELKENAQLMMDMMQVLPHSIHASMITSDEGSPKLVWCSLREEYLVTPASDLTLAHGAKMPGEWSLVGILSAQPDYVTPDFSGGQGYDQTGLLQSIIGQVSQNLAPIVRVTMGRPTAANAVTPLLIFREVT